MRYVVCREDCPEIYFGFYDCIDKAIQSIVKLSMRDKKKYILLSEAEHKDILRDLKMNAAQSPWVVYDAAIEGLPTCIEGVSAFDALKCWVKECRFTYSISEDNAHFYIRVYDEKNKDTDPIFTARAHKVLYPSEQLLNVAAAKIFRLAEELLPSTYCIRACTQAKYRAILHEAGLEEEV